MSGLIRLLRETFEEHCVLTGAFLGDFQSKACRGIQHFPTMLWRKEIKSWAQQNNSSQLDGPKVATHEG